LGIRISGNLRIGKEFGKESVFHSQKFDFCVRQWFSSQKFFTHFPQ